MHTDKLTPAQRTAVDHGRTPLLVIAGPGSGKTRVLVNRVVHLLESGEDPAGIVAVTFTTKAAGELKERIAARFGADAPALGFVGTFHALGLRIVNAAPELSGLPAGAKPVDEHEAVRLLNRALKRSGLHHEPGVSLYPVAAHISACRNRRETPGGMVGQLNVGPACVEYRKQLDIEGVVDFDDMLEGCLRVLKHPDRGTRFRPRWLLVDEYQDTNPLQFNIVTALMPPKGDGLTAVGDPNQSIYRFRGSDPSVFDKTSRKYAHASKVTLLDNFRSTPQIIGAAFQVIAGNPTSMTTRMVAHLPPGIPVRVRHFETDEDEARWIARQIRDSGAPPHQHAVLLRTNAASRLIEDALSDAALSYGITGGVRFADRRETRLVVDYLKAAVNPANVEAVKATTMWPRRGLGQAAWDELGQIPQEGNMVTFVNEKLSGGGLSSRASRSWQRWAADVTRVQAVLATDGLAATVAVVCDDVGVTDLFRTEPDRLATLLEVSASASQFERTNPSLVGSALLSGWLGFIAPPVDRSGYGARSGRVQVMTVHASKGREFRFVWMFHADGSNYPHVLSRTHEDVEEERRLFFVAMTRAQTQLTITWTAGRGRNTPPSMFVFDLPVDVEGKPAAAEFPRPTRKRSDPISQAVSRGLGQGARPVRLLGAVTSPAGGSGAPKPAVGRRSVARPAARGTLLPASDAQVGSRVRHAKFGTGTIVSVSGGRVEVSFADKARTLDLGHAPLTKV